MYSVKLSDEDKRKGESIMKRWLTVFLVLMSIVGEFSDIRADAMDSDNMREDEQVHVSSRALRRARRQENKMRDEERREEYKERGEKIRHERSERRNRAEKWQELQREHREHDRAMGRYDYLSLSAARPTYATGIARTHLLNLSVNYTYATDAYSSSGDNQDLTILAFGEGPVLVQDFLLASKLASANNILQVDLNNKTDQASNKYLSLLANQQINFLGKDEKWSFNFDFSRYLWNKRFALGVQVPLVYEKHRLRANLALPKPADLTKASVDNSIYGLVDAGGGAGSPNDFMRLYGQDTNKFIQDILNAKGMSQLGGSSMGLGDITVFGHGVFNAPYFDSMLGGVKLVIPTAQKASATKLWAPELGNGGFFQGGLFWSMVLAHRRCVNPHLFAEATGTLLRAHVKRRVPRTVSASNTDTGTATAQTLSAIASNASLGSVSDPIAFGDRIQLTKNASVTLAESARPGLSDNVTEFTMYKGPELNLRVGNIFREFIVRRGFLDVFYDVRFKFQDWVGGVARDVLNIDVYRDNTQQIAHKAGFEYSYQSDIGTRLRGSLSYVFAGKNTPKALEAGLTLYHSF